MKRVFLTSLVLLLLAFPIGCAPSATKLLRSLPSTPHFEPGHPESWKLPNGLTVLLMQDHELPLVSAALYLPGGSMWQAQDELGVAAALGDLLRSGGTAALTPQQLDRELEQLGAKISSGFAAEFGQIGFQSLSQDLERVFELFSQVVLQPRFAPDRLELWRGKTLDALRRRTEEPNEVAMVAFQQLAFQGTLLGRVFDSGDIKAVNESKIRALYQRFVRPDGAILAVSGDITRERLEQLLNRHLAGWHSAAPALPELPAIKPQPNPAIYFIELPFEQATVMWGQSGPPRLTEDYAAIDLFNGVFGSEAWESRLFERVRTRLGLAYGVFGMIAPGRSAGMNFVSLQTKGESVAQALIESLRVLKELQHQPPQLDELARIKKGTENSFVFKFDSPQNVVRRIASQQLMGFPHEYDDTYLSKLAAVGPEQVMAVANRWWGLDKLVVVVVGNQSAYQSLAQARSAPELAGYELRKVVFNEKLRL